MNDSSRSGCLRTGCIGCLSLLALLVGLVFFVGAVRMIGDDASPRPETRRLERPLPGLPPEASPSEDRPPSLPGVELPDTRAESPDEPGRGTLVLDVSMGDFRIVPGAVGEPLRIEADYDTARFELEERYEAHPDGGWTWTVGFGSKKSLLGMLLSGESGTAGNEIEIVVPRGRPLAIVGKIGIGVSEIDLGGLWVERLDLELGVGEHFLEIREPLPFPMEELLLSGSLGELELRDLGEASPAHVRIDHGMGSLVVDLGGHWRRDATIDIHSGVGETRVDLPRDARVLLPGGGPALGEARIDRAGIEQRNGELPEDAPTLDLSVDSGIGELEID